MVNLPSRMLAGNRAADSQFDAEERLYRRCSKDQVLDGRLAPPAIAIDFPDMSVNRGKYSEPEDVRLAISHKDLNWDKWGIAQFERRHVPSEPDEDVKANNPKHRWTWDVVHVPCQQNYAHTEVRTFRDGSFDRKLDVPKSVKKWFRHILSPRTRVIVEPQL